MTEQVRTATQQYVHDRLPEGASFLGPSRGSAETGLAPWRLQRVLDYIDANHAQRLEIAMLAEVAALSPFHFARMFKVSTGLAPHAFVTRKRVDVAAALLRDTDLPLREIFQRAGFKTQSHFTSVCRRTTGITPAAYRRQYRAARASD
jgi:AraC-like DNA-binding protein